MSLDLEKLCEKLYVPYYVGADISVIERDIYQKIDELIIANDILSKENKNLNAELDDLHHEIISLADRCY